MDRRRQGRHRHGLFERWPRLVHDSPRHLDRDVLSRRSIVRKCATWNFFLRMETVFYSKRKRDLESQGRNVLRPLKDTVTSQDRDAKGIVYAKKLSWNRAGRAFSCTPRSRAIQPY